VQFTRALSVDLAPEVRVNTVCPSIVDTPMSRGDLGLAEGFGHAEYPVQTPQEVATHVLYLSSARSRPVNGTALVLRFRLPGAVGVPGMSDQGVVMTTQTTGRVIVISGGGTGIGAATAALYAEQGDRVVVLGRRR